MKHDNIYEMKLHEQILKKGECGAYDSTNIYILRVAGGWVYTIKNSSTFVPFDNEFQSRKQ